MIPETLAKPRSSSLEKSPKFPVNEKRLEKFMMFPPDATVELMPMKLSLASIMIHVMRLEPYYAYSMPPPTEYPGTVIVVLPLDVKFPNAKLNSGFAIVLDPM